MTPIVSILMTAYNREKYIAESIESVLASTFVDFELIIVDDCSSDRTVKIAKSYALLDKRVKVYINEKNLGDYPNRNKAASYAIGKYIKYLDSDDIMSASCLDHMVYAMEQNPDCAFGISSSVLSEVKVHYPETAYRTHFFDRGILDISPSGSIIRKDVFEIEGGFWELRCVSDFEFWLRLSLKYPLIELKKDLIYWRQHNQQEIHLGNTAYLEHTISILYDKFQLCYLNEDEKLTVLKKYKKNTMRHLLRNILKLGFFEFKRLKEINELNFIDAL